MSEWGWGMLVCTTNIGVQGGRTPVGTVYIRGGPEPLLDSGRMGAAVS